jgi:RimJ/RimL family protein N-acetyltransferase
MTVAALQVKFTSADISLRLASEDDYQQVWEWRNDPEVRAISFAPDIIGWDRHLRWMSNKLGDSQCLWLIAEHIDLGRVGHIRFDIFAERQALVAVTVAPTLRGRGLGKILIERGVGEAFSKLPIDTVIGQIKPFNVASEKAFRQVGFRSMNPTTINGWVANQLFIARDDAQQWLVF